MGLLSLMKRLFQMHPDEEARDLEADAPADDTPTATPLAYRNRSKPQGRNHDTIVARSVRIRGSVHASGEARVVVNTLRSWNKKRTEAPLQVSGSVHEQGHESLTVESTDAIGEEVIPEPADDGRGFATSMEDRFALKGSEFTIDRLIVVEDDRPERLKALCEQYDTVYDEVHIRGAVHETGAVDVTIDDCYIIEEPRFH